MSNSLGDGIKGVLDYGINLKLESYEEENYYILQMCEFFNDKSDFKAYLSGDRSFEIELDRDTPIMEVFIKDSILQLLPYSDDIFEAFTLILSFIAKHHTEIIQEFRESGGSKIETLKENEEIEEPSSDDDYEWI